MIVHIKDRQCPTCGAEVVEMGVKTDCSGKVWRHCNGQQFEWVKFSCGMRIEWIPNFNAAETRGECRNDQQVKTRREKYNALIQDLIDRVNAADIDQFGKDELVHSIRWRMT